MAELIRERFCLGALQTWKREDGFKWGSSTLHTWEVLLATVLEALSVPIMSHIVLYVAWSLGSRQTSVWVGMYMYVCLSVCAVHRPHPNHIPAVHSFRSKPIVAAEMVCIHVVKNLCLIYCIYCATCLGIVMLNNALQKSCLLCMGRFSFSEPTLLKCPSRVSCMASSLCCCTVFVYMDHSLYDFLIDLFLFSGAVFCSWVRNRFSQWLSRLSLIVLRSLWKLILLSVDLMA